MKNVIVPHFRYEAFKCQNYQDIEALKMNKNQHVLDINFAACDSLNY